MVTKTKGIGDLFKEVIDKGLCTVCGACVGDCPYVVFYKGKIRMLDLCNRTEGHCYEYCPRTFTDLDAINQKVHGTAYTGDEIGTVRQVVMARAGDAKTRTKGQYGGTVSALLAMALDNGLIDAAILSKNTDEKAACRVRGPFGRAGAGRSGVKLYGLSRPGDAEQVAQRQQGQAWNRGHSLPGHRPCQDGRQSPLATRQHEQCQADHRTFLHLGTGL